jgi:FAD binding domain
MQDAVNVGWKLAAVVNGWAPPGLLDTYESERYPVGERVMMHSQAQLALAAPGPEVSALRELFGELASKPQVATHLAGLLAGSDVRYEIGDDHRLSGLLVPDLVFDDGRRLADLFHEARPLLLDLSSGDATAAAAPWSDRVDALAARMTEPPAAALLIRPDGYVAWAADTFEPDDAARLRAALRRWFGDDRGDLKTESP